jgi:ATP-dependent Clp protease ATP-binding subunit ClpC
MNWFQEAENALREREVRREAEDNFWNKFTPRARQALILGQEEARKMKQDFVGAEHLLVGLMELENGIPANALKEFGVTLEFVRAELAKQKVTEDFGDPVNTPLTPRLRTVIRTAKTEAAALGYTYVGTDHLFLGLLAETAGEAWRILRAANVDLERMREMILKEIKS